MSQSATLVAANWHTNQTKDLRIRRRAWIVYGLGVVLYGLVFSVWQVEPVPFDVHLLSVALMALCFIPIAIWSATGSKDLPMFELICLAYALQFSVPVYLQPNAVAILGTIFPLAWTSVFTTLLLVIVGVASMILSYYRAKRSLLVRKLIQVDLPLTPRGRTVYLSVAVMIGITAQLLQLSGVAGPFQAIIGLMYNQLGIAAILLGYQVYSAPGTKVRARIVFYLLITQQVLFGIISGLLESAFIPLVFLVTIKWQATRRIPWRLLIVGSLAFMVLNAAKPEYRGQVWYGRAESNELSLGERIGLWFDLSANVAGSASSEDASSVRQAIVRRATARLDLLHRFTHVQNMTPATVPYYNGESYSYFLYAWIPRVVWPDKPVLAANTRTDVDYGFLTREGAAAGTNIGIGHLPEAYANFGLLGIIGVLALEGMLFAVLAHVLNSPRSEGGRAIYLSVMVFFLNGIGASAVVILGALLQNVLANILLLRPFATGYTAKPGSDRDEIQQIQQTTHRTSANAMSIPASWSH